MPAEAIPAGAVLEVDGLGVRYGRHGMPAVRNVSFALGAERVGLVGESGSGKSTLGRAAAARGRPGGGPCPALRGPGPHRAWQRAMNRLRGRRMSLIMQDPRYSLNPVRTIGSQLAESARVHLGRRASAGAHPYTRALALRPPVVLLDEPTSALDVSVKAEVLNLLTDLREEGGLTYVLVSHDLAVIGHMCDEVVVMREGRCEDRLSADDLRARRTSAVYTRKLIQNSLL